MIKPIPTSLKSHPRLPPPPYSSPLPTVEEQQNNQKRKREEEEEEEMGCESPQQINKSIQFHPTTPEKSTPYPPNPSLVQRMLTDTCFKCKQQGHWSMYCPNNNNNNNHSSALSSNKQIHCRCRHGFCDVRISNSERNKGRLYFACPIKRGAPCGTFVKWCDDERALEPSLVKYPKCKCGAGVCKREMEGAKYYFTCPIKQSFGSCGYRVSEVELLNNASTDELVNSTSIGNDLTNGFAEGSDLLLTTKRTRITDNSENLSPVAVSEILEGRSGGSPIYEVNSQPVGFPEMEFGDDQQLINLASWEALEDKAYPSSRFSTPSRISCQQSVFPRDIFSADATFGVFPSFDPIDAPKQTSTLNSQIECNDLTIKTPNQCTQLSTDVVSPNRTPGSEKIKEQKHREVVVYTLQGLLKDLEGFHFHQHESMRHKAEAVFSVLNCLGFECKQFSDYVWEFINLAKSMTEIDKSMENSPTLEEHSKFLEEEKVRLANIRDDCVKIETLLAVSDEKRNLLSQEVTNLQAVLLEKRKELEICEVEKMKAETWLDNMKRRMSEVDSSLKDETRQAEAAKKKFVERDTKQAAARTALEKAKRALEN